MAFIVTLGPMSGAHFNPVVSLADRAFGGLTSADVLAYIPAQVSGCCAGQLSPAACSTSRSSSCRPGPARLVGLWLAEAVATAGLLLVVSAVVRSERAASCRSPLALTSAGRTSGQPRPALPTPPSSSAGCCQTRSPGSGQGRRRASSCPRRHLPVRASLWLVDSASPAVARGAYLVCAVWGTGGWVARGSGLWS